MEKTYKDLNVLISNLNGVIGQAETKVQKKIQKLYEKVKSNHESYSSQIEELRLDNASTDDKGILLLDDKGGYKYTKEGIKKLTKDIDGLNAKTFEFKPIEVINTNGLEKFTFLEDWTTGISFVKEEEEEL